MMAWVFDNALIGRHRHQPATLIRASWQNKNSLDNNAIQQQWFLWLGSWMSRVKKMFWSVTQQSTNKRNLFYHIFYLSHELSTILQVCRVVVKWQKMCITKASSPHLLDENLECNFVYPVAQSGMWTKVI